MIKRRRILWAFGCWWSSLKNYANLLSSVKRRGCQWQTSQFQYSLWNVSWFAWCWAVSANPTEGLVVFVMLLLAQRNIGPEAQLMLFYGPVRSCFPNVIGHLLVSLSHNCGHTTVVDYLCNLYGLFGSSYQYKETLDSFLHLLVGGQLFHCVSRQTKSLPGKLNMFSVIPNSEYTWFNRKMFVILILFCFYGSLKTIKLFLLFSLLIIRNVLLYIC